MPHPFMFWQGFGPKSLHIISQPHRDVSRINCEGFVGQKIGYHATYDISLSFNTWQAIRLVEPWHLRREANLPDSDDEQRSVSLEVSTGDYPHQSAR